MFGTLNSLTASKSKSSSLFFLLPFLLKGAKSNYCIYCTLFGLNSCAFSWTEYTQLKNSYSCSILSFSAFNWIVYG